MKSRFLKENSFPQDIVHMIAENKPAKEHNETQLNTRDTQLILIDALIKFLRILFYHKVRLMQLNKGRRVRQEILKVN